MAARIRAFDWGSTPLGPMEAWPGSLRTSVAIILKSPFPMLVWWGSELINIYNDACLEPMATRHPGALGAPAARVWADIWDTLGPEARSVLEGGTAVENARLPLPIPRDGSLEERYWTYSFSPIPDESGGVGGVLATARDITEQVQDERQLRMFNELAENAPGPAATAEEACRAAVAVLARNIEDFPTAAVYLVRPPGELAELVAGDERALGALPNMASLRTEADGGLPLQEALESGVVIVDDVRTRFPALAGAGQGDTPKDLVVLSLHGPGHGRAVGFLVAGASPLRVLDERYLNLFRLTAHHLEAVLAAARATELDQQRLQALAELDVESGNRAPTFPNARILLVDDDVEMREHVARLLRREGATVKSIADGPTALEAARSEPFELAILGVSSFASSGFWLLRALKGDPKLKHIAVILVSGRAGEETLLEGLRAGADDYLVQPFSTRELIARTRTHLELGRHRDAAERERERLYAFFEQAPVPIMVWEGPDHRIALYNQKTREMMAPGSEPYIGQPMLEYAPSVARSQLIATLDEVYRTGQPRRMLEYPVQFPVDGGMQERYFSSFFHPIRDWEGNVRGVMAAGYEVTEQVIARRELSSARAAAEAASRAKDEFLAMLGHELRNPLSPMLTALELMRLRGMQSRELEVLSRQVGHLTRLVDDLLDVTRFTRGKIQLHKEKVELAEVVGRAIEVSSPLLEQRRHVLRVNVERRGLLIEADPERMTQVIANLLNNAAKYSEPGSRITIDAERVGDRVRLRVKDEGAGISPEMLGKIFDVFVQQRQTIDRSRGGLGLGLTIVRTLVEMHGGTVSAHSEGPGRGAEFTIELPALTPAGLDGERETAGLFGAAPRPRAQRVLVVDDNRDAAAMLKIALEALGYTVEEAHDGPTALEIAERFEPTIALVDIGLPVMDGYELAQRLRARTPARDRLRLIAVTGYGQDADRRRSAEAGFDEHLVKPVDLTELERIVSRLSVEPEAGATGEMKRDDVSASGSAE